MTHRMALLVSLMLAAAAPCGAQTPASGTTPSATPPAAPSASTPAPSTPASSTASSSDKAPPVVAAGTDSTATPSEPTPELLKEARREGFTPKKRDGVTKFCQTAASLGTRFEKETCIDEAHLQAVVQQRQDVRNQMNQTNACVGASCKGH
jgi:hypothetical protein